MNERILTLFTKYYMHFDRLIGIGVEKTWTWLVGFVSSYSNQRIPSICVPSSSKGNHMSSIWSPGIWREKFQDDREDNARSKCKIMDSSKFLRISGKGGGRFEWTGSAKDLDKFFSALGYTGTWSQPTGEGHQIYKQTVHLHLVCHEKIPSNTGQEN